MNFVNNRTDTSLIHHSINPHYRLASYLTEALCYRYFPTQQHILFKSNAKYRSIKSDGCNADAIGQPKETPAINKRFGRWTVLLSKLRSFIHAYGQPKDPSQVGMWKRASFPVSHLRLQMQGSRQSKISYDPYAFQKTTLIRFFQNEKIPI